MQALNFVKKDQENHSIFIFLTRNNCVMYYANPCLSNQNEVGKKALVNEILRYKGISPFRVGQPGLVFVVIIKSSNMFYRIPFQVLLVLNQRNYRACAMCMGFRPSAPR